MKKLGKKQTKLCFGGSKTNEPTQEPQREVVTIEEVEKEIDEVIEEESNKRSRENAFGGEEHEGKDSKEKEAVEAQPPLKRTKYSKTNQEKKDEVKCSNGETVVHSRKRKQGRQGESLRPKQFTTQRWSKINEAIKNEFGGVFLVLRKCCY